MARKTLTDKGVDALKAKAKLYNFPDPALPGHYVRVAPTGHKSFVAVTRNPNGKQVWTTIGNSSHMHIEEARAEARKTISRIKGGQNVAGPQSYESVACDWIKRHVRAKGLITEGTNVRHLKNHILPTWGGREFTSIKRGDVARLLDTVEEDRKSTRLNSSHLGI